MENVASMNITDVLYIRCDWRDVQKRPGRLDLHPVWELTMDAARRHGLRVAFRVQMSSPNFQPQRLALPDFVADKVPMVDIGNHAGSSFVYVEPRYDHPKFQSAFRELNELLADRFDNQPNMEFVDLMMYGFWGEGHTGAFPHPFPDYYTAETTCLAMAELQLDIWRKVPLAVNTQTDINGVGNDAVRQLALAQGCWLRSDSILIEEPEQIGQIAGRPPGTAVIMEDGDFRHYRMEDIPEDSAGISRMENAMLHVPDLGANYWSLWTEAAQVRRFAEHNPYGFQRLRERMGYRIRPSWIWQRKRHGTDEIIVAIANDGGSGMPGVLWLQLESVNGRLCMTGSIDKGQPFGGQLRLASFVLPPDFGCKELLLRAMLETKPGVLHSVQWSCAQLLQSDGAFPIRLAGHEGEGWRKGV